MSKEEALGGARTKSLSIVGRVFANLCIYNFATKTVLRPELKKKLSFVEYCTGGDSLSSRVELKENVYHSKLIGCISKSAKMVTNIACATK